MQYQTEILHFQEGARSRNPTPDATIAAAQLNALSDAGSQIAVLVDLVPELPYRSREIRTLVVKTYWSSSGSIVARLRRALAAANRHLITFNQEAISGNKCSGSITCAVFSGDELFLGQVGAAYAYVYQPPNAAGVGESELEVFPKRDRLLIPLGGTVPPVIHIGYTTIYPGSMVCLATTKIAESQAREVWQQALSLPKLTLISSHLSREFTSRRSTGSIILFSAQATSVPKPAPWAQPRTHIQRTTQPEPERHTSVTPASLKPISAPRSRSGARPTSTEIPSAVRSASPAYPDRLPGFDSEEPLPTGRDAQAGLSLTPVREWIEQSQRNWRERRRLRQLRATERSTTAERARLRQALRTLLPGKIESSQKTASRTPPPERSPLLRWVALGLLLVVTLVTLGKYLQLGGPLKAEELMEEAKTLRTEAYSTQDPGDWHKLLDLAGQIVRLDPQNAEAAQLKEEAQQAVDTLESAAMLSVTPLLDLGTAPAPRRVLVADGWIYVLETATDAVIALPLNQDGVSSSAEGPTAILRRGQSYLGQTVNHLVDFGWIEPGGSYPDGAVFVYSDGGDIFIYEPALGPGSITVQHIQGDLNPGNVTAMETFGENIYLVDRQANQVLMYEPVNGIYDAPRSYFAEGSAPDLQLAQDLAIDGRVYLLMGDGKVLSYFSGSLDPSFEINSLPDADFTPLVMTIDPDPDSGLVFLADSQRERIIALDKRGSFVHQYRLPKGELQRIEALTVNSQSQVLYLIADNQLFAAPLPNFGVEPAQ